MSHKEDLAWTPPVRRRPGRVLHAIVASTCFLAGTTWLLKDYYHPDLPHRRCSTVVPSVVTEKCPQVDALKPSMTTPALAHMDAFLASASFRNDSIARLAGAVQIPTESYDAMGPIGTDPRWDIMFDFAVYLQRTFPLIHKTLKVEKVNTHGLLYTWQGSEPLKPTVLMAHQDVVPVAPSTVSQWTHPPYSGYYDGQFLWGRGASDCKNTLVGIMEAVELLIGAGFTPRRTLILSFGFDEESSGMQGAGHLAPFLLERYGKDGVATIVDEGSGIGSVWGAQFALPGVAEKGYIDVEIVVRMPGGHSSIPPDHTGIGVMAELITAIEANPYEPHFHDENPFLSFLSCGAEYGPEFPSEIKKMLPGYSPDPSKKDELADLVAKVGGPVAKYLFTTSVAVDVIDGGVKVNALPERTTVLVNHRVNVGDSTADVEAKLAKLASGVAQRYNLTLHAFNGEAETPSSITLSARRGVLEPAPVTPTNIDTTTPYAVLSGTTRALYNNTVVMAPGMSTGNTDTRYYWGLTREIFRFGPGWDPDQGDGLGNIHTVNEKVSILNHIRGVQWFSTYIRNMDEADIA